MRTGTYAGTPLRTTWATGRRRGDESYVSIAVGPSGALRFHVAAAANLASMQALYAAHAWRRIGG